MIDCPICHSNRKKSSRRVHAEAHVERHPALLKDPVALSLTVFIARDAPLQAHLRQRRNGPRPSRSSNKAPSPLAPPTLDKEPSHRIGQLRTTPRGDHSAPSPKPAHIVRDICWTTRSTDCA
jgi:hypothetical protein